MLREIVSVRVVRDRRLCLAFNDGVEGEVDIAAAIPFLGVFAPLNDPDYFARVRVNTETGTIEWPSGADLDPDVLYALASGKPMPSDRDPSPKECLRMSSRALPIQVGFVAGTGAILLMAYPQGGLFLVVASLAFGLSCFALIGDLVNVLWLNRKAQSR